DFLKFLSKVGESTPKSAWIQDDWEAARKLAMETNKPIFIDFCSVNDANGRLNERRVFLVPEVATAFEKFVRVKLYTDVIPDSRLRRDEAMTLAERQHEMQQSLGLEAYAPMYAIVEPTDIGPGARNRLRAKLVDHRSGILETADFVRFLRREGPPLAAATRA